MTDIYYFEVIIWSLPSYSEKYEYWIFINIKVHFLNTDKIRMRKIFLTIAFIGMGHLAMAQKNIPQIQKQIEQGILLQIQERYDLSPSQVGQIESLNEKMNAEWKEGYENNKLNGKKGMTLKETIIRKIRMDAEIKRILTSEQYNRWQADKKAIEEKIKKALQKRK